MLSPNCEMCGSKQVYSRGLCKADYQRARKSGRLENFSFSPQTCEICEEVFTPVRANDPVCASPVCRHLDAVPAKLWASLREENGCWLWTGKTGGGGYAQLRFRGRRKMAHIRVWEFFYGPVSEGLQLDHLCRIRHCVNPDHLDPVPCRVNLLRGDTLAAQNAAKTHCPAGHPYEGANLLQKSGGGRTCRTCKNEKNREYMRNYYAAQRRSVPAPDSSLSCL